MLNRIIDSLLFAGSAIKEAFFAVLSTCLACLSWLLGFVFGKVKWQAPSWCKWLLSLCCCAYRWVFATRKRGFISVLGSLLVVGGSYFGWQYYQHMPKPVLTAYEVKAPALSIYDENGKLYTNPLVIAFAESVAPVQLIGKTITQGIAINPKIAGEWTWDDEKTLAFRPKNDWPVDAKFELNLDKKKLLSNKIKLDQYEASFATAPFSVAISEAQFYQDPIDANLKKLVASVHFSHPVDAEDFKKHIELSLGNGLSYLGEANDASKFSVTFDKLKLNAYIHSAPLAIPKEDTSLNVTLNEGIKTTRGGNATAEHIQNKITVPGLYSLTVTEASMALVDNDRYEPEQVLLLTTSAALNDAGIAGKVHAWLLPEFNPKTPTAERDAPYLWTSDETTKKVLASSQPLDLKAVASDGEYTPLHSYKFKAPVGRSIYIKADAGLTAFGGYESQKASLHTIQVLPYPKAVKLLSQGALLSLSGDRQLGYMTRGLDGVKIEIGRVLPNQLHHLVNQSNGAFTQDQISEDVLDTLVERYTDKRALPKGEFGKPSYDSIDFGQYLKDKSTRGGGVFMVKVQSYTPPKDGETENERSQQQQESDEAGNDGQEAENDGADAPPDTRFILVTDLGVIAKKALDGSQDVFVQSISSGLPVAGARVQVVGRNGQEALSGSTDASGHVHFPHLDDLRREKQALMYVISKDNDLSFLPINRYDRELEMSRFDVGGIDNAATSQQLSAYSFTDRGIYRPGETAHIAMIARTANWQGVLDGLPLEAEVTDPRGISVMKKTLKLGSTGFESFDFVSRDSSATGDYQVSYYLVKDNKRDAQIGSTNFKVRDFEPDRLKVNTTLADRAIEGWITPSEANARIKAMHLFGSPANDRRVEAEMTLTPAYPSFSKFADYQFQDRFKLKEPFSEQLNPVTTDANGEAKLNLNLQRFASATYRLYISAKVFEAGGGRSVPSEASALVSSAPYLVGVKADGELNYISKNTARSIHWLAVDNSLKTINVAKLSKVLIERKFVSVLVKQSNGTYKYESRKKENILETTPFSMGEKGAEIVLNTATPGDFAIALKDEAGNELNRIEYSIAGAANLSRSLERNAELQLSLNKKDYQAGDTIEVSIRAPYVGAGLITIERDKVYSHTWFKTSTTSSVQKIVLPPSFEGNGYISVQFVRDAGSDEIFMSPLSYGVVPFAVNMGARRQALTVLAPATIKPGKSLDIEVSTPTPTKVVVFAVDEGVLQVARYKTPDPIGFFFQKRALQVGTTQILDQILPDFQQLLNAAAPGGDGDAVLGRHLNPFKKKRQLPIAYWSGLVDVDAKGKTLQYQVPETFNGKLHLYAVAVSAGKIGVYDGGTDVVGDLILTPNVPVSVSPNDEFIVSVGIFNNMKGLKKVPVIVSLVPDKSITVLSSNKVMLNIASQQEEVTEFRLKANDILGSTSLQFMANADAAATIKQGKANETIGIRPLAVFRTQLTTGQFSSTTQTVVLNRNLYAHSRDVKAGTSLSPLVWAQGLSDYLGTYEYMCTEQLVSKSMPALVLGNDLLVDKSKINKESPNQESHNKTLQILRERQNEDGSFGLWSANMDVVPFASIYAVHYLVEAKEHGLSVPTDMLTNANNWLSQYAVGGSNGLSGVRERAYAIYLLTRQGIVTTGMLATLQKELDERYAKEWPLDLAGAYVAASYKLLQQDAIANKILKNVPWQISHQKSLNDTVYYDINTHDAQLIYLTSKHFKDKVNTIPSKVITQLGEAISRNDYHSLSAAYLIMAFDAYGNAGGSNAKIDVLEVAKNGTTTPLTMAGGLIKTGQVSTNATKLQFKKGGSGLQDKTNAFYLISENGYDRIDANFKAPMAEQNQGIEISREFTTLDGKPLLSAKVGEEFLVKLNYRSTERDFINEVAIVDLLPGGVEPIFNVLAEAASNTQSVSQNANEAEGEVEGNASSAKQAWAAPLGERSLSNWQPSFVDIRDDRVVLYGNLSRNVGTFVYRVRATNAGLFQVPAAFAEGMYDRKLQGRGKIGKLQVVKPDTVNNTVNKPVAPVAAK